MSCKDLASLGQGLVVLVKAQHYRTVYDIAQEPWFAVEVVWLSGGFVLAGLLWLLIQRAQDRKRIDPPTRSGITTPKVLILFGSMIAVIGIGLMGWDHWRLMKAIEKGEAQTVEGLIQSWGTERVRTARTDKREYHTYERFYVGDSIWFGYYQDVGQAGFHNGKDPQIQLKDGMQARATYLYADGTDDPPRIVKMEIAE
jgi:hypothetical protein